MKRISLLAFVIVSSFLQAGCLKQSNVTETSLPVVNQPTAFVEPEVDIPADASLNAVEQATLPAALPATLPATLPADAIALDAVPAIPELTTVPVQLDMVSFTVSTREGEPLDVRASHRNQAPIIGNLAQGSSVQLLETDSTGTWARIVSAAGVDGWVAAAYLVNTQNGFRMTDLLPTAPAPEPVLELGLVDATRAPDNPQGEPDDYSPPFRINTRSGEPLKVLADPGITASVMATLPHGTVVYQVEVVNSVWSKVATPNGDLSGYVATDFLEPVQ